MSFSDKIRLHHMLTLFPVRFSLIPHSDHGESMPEPLNLAEMSWSDLLRQIRDNPDPKVRQSASFEAMKRVWDRPNQPAERIDPKVFEPDW